MIRSLHTVQVSILFHLFLGWYTSIISHNCSFDGEMKIAMILASPFIPIILYGRRGSKLGNHEF